MNVSLSMFIRLLKSDQKSKLAEKLNCSVEYLYHYGSGFRNPSPKRMKQIKSFATDQGFYLVNSEKRLSDG